MTFWHEIQKYSFQNRFFLCFLSGGHFWPLEAKKRKKPYSVDPKILSFAVFWPPEAKYDLLALNTKKLFSKSNFFVFSEWGSFLASGGHKTRKTLFRDPENPLFGLENSFICHLRPSEAKNDLLAFKTIFFLFKIGYLYVFLVGGHFWPLEAAKRKKPYSVDPKFLSLAVLLPGDAKIDLLALHPKKFFSKSGLFVFSEFKT